MEAARDYQKVRIPPRILRKLRVPHEPKPESGVDDEEKRGLRAAQDWAKYLFLHVSDLLRPSDSNS